MKKYLKEYQKTNPEKFNEKLFTLREEEDVLKAVEECLRGLEILDEIKLDYVAFDHDESQFGPIVSNEKGGKELYKPILPSRLDRIRYRFIITPSESVKTKPILSDDDVVIEKSNQTSANSYYRESFFYMNKLVDHWFYINEGSRYFLINQIVDNAAYSTGDSISLKSLLMPITLQRKNIIITSEGTNNSYSVPTYNLVLFAKSINVLMYYMAKYSFNDLIRMNNQTSDNLIEERMAKRCPAIIDKINNFFGLDLKFSDKLEELLVEGREVFRVSPDESVYISVDKEKLEEKDKNLLAILGCFFDMRLSGKQKKTLAYTYDNLITPMYWITALASYFTVNTDPLRRFDKIKTMLVSLDRLTDDSTRAILRFPDEDKKNSLAILRYMLRNFDYLNEKDPNDFDDKRIRLVESLLFPLRNFISKQTYRILNAPTRSRQVLDRIFSNLTPTFLLKETVVSELLRFYNATNELDFMSVLKCTLTGPQSLTKTVSNLTRDVQPSQIGRLSLVSASASNPGLSSLLVPFCELEDGMYFAPKKEIDESN